MQAYLGDAVDWFVDTTEKQTPQLDGLQDLFDFSVHVNLRLNSINSMADNSMLNDTLF